MNSAYSLSSSTSSPPASALGPEPSTSIASTPIFIAVSFHAAMIKDEVEELTFLTTRTFDLTTLTTHTFEPTTLGHSHFGT
ncbi:hypothetical protein M378DRAFT_17227 [Amanita muscaria Koide BX008]|uniref:Uncharacterized protein n=1 Tax=Amanita muscaria (strain Koide BX008) TaxID=946122 RepID=A0A0C2WJG2_AMAMK|nr:hypothetical protein M378DRAFT_17227 [Amanita muscaria Koide BX008]